VARSRDVLEDNRKHSANHTPNKVSISTCQKKITHQKQAAP
jgi:hypothetical protein